MIEAALFGHLSTDAGLSALVSTRVYPVQLPQDADLPAVTFQRISTRPVTHRDSTVPTYSRPRYQFNCWAASFDDAVTLRAALRAAMGTLAQASGPRIDVALMQDDRDVVEATPGRWVASLDYFVWHAEYLGD